VYNYVKGRSVGEILLDGFCASLFALATVGLTSVIYNIMFNSPTITFGGW
jgi:hypothetical protein